MYAGVQANCCARRHQTPRVRQADNTCRHSPGSQARNHIDGGPFYTTRLPATPMEKRRGRLIGFQLFG